MQQLRELRELIPLHAPAHLLVDIIETVEHIALQLWDITIQLYGLRFRKPIQRPEKKT